jgi:DNA ligase (NAD+)
MGIQESANDAYYNTGEKILTDQEFDLLADDGLEIKNFRSKTDHFQPMGSLKKLKTKEDYDKWVKGDVKASPKLDGNSLEMVFEDGILVKAITRGDGFVGNDVTDKVKHCNFKAQLGTGSLKAEALMKKVHQKDYDKNIRNVVSGTLNRKTPDVSELQKIDIIVFDDLNYFKCDDMTYEILEAQFNKMKEFYEYEIDGLVLELLSNVYEEDNELLPANKVALKFNKEGVDGVVGSIEWNLGKHSRITPVLVLEKAVEIDGTNVQRISASNYSLLVAAGLGIGAKVQVIKSGDIIPFISKVIERSDYVPSVYCPECSTKAEYDENKVHMLCNNVLCTGKTVVKLQHIFNIFDCEYISDSTVESLYNFGFKTILKFFKATVDDISGLPGFGPSKAKNIISKLKGVKLTEAQVIECAMVKGISSSQSKKLIEHFGSLENFFRTKFTVDDIKVIDSFGDVLAETVRNNKNLFEITYNDLIECGLQIIEAKPKTVGAKNIVFTGKCEKYGRKELEKVLEDAGFNVQSGINKDTQILLCEDPNSGSSKVKKAEKFGTQVMTYIQFFEENGI